MTKNASVGPISHAQGSEQMQLDCLRVQPFALRGEAWSDPPRAQALNVLHLERSPFLPGYHFAYHHLRYLRWMKPPREILQPVLLASFGMDIFNADTAHQSTRQQILALVRL